MSQRIWLVLVVVVVVAVFGYMFWPTATNDTTIQPTGGAETTQPAEEPATAE